MRPVPNVEPVWTWMWSTKRFAHTHTHTVAQGAWNCEFFSCLFHTCTHTRSRCRYSAGLSRANPEISRHKNSCRFSYWHFVLSWRGNESLFIFFSLLTNSTYWYGMVGEGVGSKCLLICGQHFAACYFKHLNVYYLLMCSCSLQSWATLNCKIWLSVGTWAKAHRVCRLKSV